MTNTYRITFTARCPNNDQVISYCLEIEADHVIMAEDIVAHANAAKELFRPYHENMADYLFTELGGRQVMKAFHHGVWIETKRGF